MITEDYVSSEIARLLEERGFNEKCFALYNPDGVLIPSGVRLNNIQVGRSRVKGCYAAPTLQMVMKWLREVYSLHIWIGHTAGKGLSWYYEIHGMSDGKVKHIGGIQCGSYEVACESAIRYCLENLKGVNHENREI
jgi:hypothetical protein